MGGIHQGVDNNIVQKLKLENELNAVASDISVGNADFNSPDPTKKPKSIIGKNFDKRDSILEEE